MKTKNYNDFIAKAILKHGKKFSDKNLSKKFIPYFESQERITVRFSNDVVKRGRIGITTGWNPCFILMLTTRSLGSSWTLSNEDIIQK